MKINSDGSRDCIETETSIRGFFGKYRPLSNFHICQLEVDGLIYKSSEAAYMAQKTLDHNIRVQLSEIDKPADAKRFGRSIVLRNDWEQYKSAAMLKVLMCKYTQNIDVFDLLMSTGNKELVETNNWGDRYWGVDSMTGNGYNILGKVLMDVRSTLRTIYNES